MANKPNLLERTLVAARRGFNLTDYLTSDKRKTPDHVNKLEQGFQQRLGNMLRGMPDNLRGQVQVYSGYRSPERQKELYAAAVQKYGAARARNYVAPPGKSFHNQGLATDLKYASPAAKAWVHENAAQFGLSFPMSHEPWHIEPMGVRTGKYKPSEIFDPGAPAQFPSVINKNAPKEVIERLQSQLTQMGFNPGPVDGQWGKATESAVKAFQAAQGLPTTGNVGPQTTAAINSFVSPQSLSPSLVAEQNPIAQQQRAITASAPVAPARAPVSPNLGPSLVSPPASIAQQQAPITPTQSLAAAGMAGGPGGAMVTAGKPALTPPRSGFDAINARVSDLFEGPNLGVAPPSAALQATAEIKAAQERVRQSRPAWSPLNDIPAPALAPSFTPPANGMASPTGVPPNLQSPPDGILANGHMAQNYPSVVSPELAAAAAAKAQSLAPPPQVAKAIEVLTGQPAPITSMPTAQAVPDQASILQAQKPVVAAAPVPPAQPIAQPPATIQNAAFAPQAAISPEALAVQALQAEQARLASFNGALPVSAPPAPLPQARPVPPTAPLPVARPPVPVAPLPMARPAPPLPMARPVQAPPLPAPRPAPLMAAPMPSIQNASYMPGPLPSPASQAITSAPLPPLSAPRTIQNLPVAAPPPVSPRPADLAPIAPPSIPTTPMQQQLANGFGGQPSVFASPQQMNGFGGVPGMPAGPSVMGSPYKGLGAPYTLADKLKIGAATVGFGIPGAVAAFAPRAVNSVRNAMAPANRPLTNAQQALIQAAQIQAQQQAMRAQLQRNGGGAQGGGGLMEFRNNPRDPTGSWGKTSMDRWSEKVSQGYVR